MARCFFARAARHLGALPSLVLSLVGFISGSALAAQLPPLEEFDTPYQKWLENDHLPVGRPMSTGADPVVLATGNLLVQETDLVIPGRGMDLVIGRSYRSGAADDTRLGRRWTLNLFESLTIAFTEKTWYFYAGALHEVPPATGVQDGEVYTAFVHTGTFYRNGQLRIDNFRGGVNASTKILGSPLGIFAALKYTGNFTPIFGGPGLIVGFTTPTTFELRGHDGTIRTFIHLDGDLEQHKAKVYRIATIVDRFGNRQEFHYSPTAQPSPLGYPTRRLEYVLDTYGRRVDLEYDEDGWLWKVRDFDGREVVYGHDDIGNLTSVRSPLAVHSGDTGSPAVGRTTTYQYGEVAFDTEHSILKVFDAVEGSGGTPYLDNTYDKSGQRVVRQIFGGTNGSGVAAGGTWTFMNEQAEPPLTIPTKSFPPAHLGVTTPPPGWWKGPSGAQFAEAARSFQIDPNGNCKLIILDKDGAERLTILFTGRRDPLSVAPPHPQISTLVNIPVVNGLAVATGCSLISPIAALRSGEPSCYVTERTFNLHGQVTEELGPASLVRYAYNSSSTDACQRGNLLRKDVIEVLSASPLSLGKQQTTLYAYEPLYNQVRAVVDPRGTSVLGAAQEPFTPHDGGAVTLARYGHTSTFDYQEQDVTAAGPLQAYAADWNIDLTQVTQHEFLDPLGWSNSAIVHHDGLGDVNGDGLVSQWMGNLIRGQEPDAQVPANIGASNLTFTTQTSQTLAAFNAHGYPLWTKDEFEKQTSFEYWSGQDPQGDGTTITLNPADAYTPYTLDGTVGGAGQGFLKKTILPHGVETSLKYDAYGNVAETTDPRGQVWKTVSNALGEKLETEDPRGYKTRWTYDLNGSLLAEKSQHLAPVFSADEHATGAESPAPTGEWTSSNFEYDLKNQLVEETHRANFKKDAGSPLVEKEITTRYRYDKVGNRVLTLTPESVNQAGNVIVSIFDERGLVFSESRGGAPSAGWAGMLAHEHIVESVPTSGPIATTRTDYHPSGKPALITDPEGNATTIEYDGFLRLKKSTDAANNCVTSVWDCVGQLLETKQWEGAEVTGTLLTHSKTKYDERGRAYQVDRLRAALGAGISVTDGPLTPNDTFVTSRVKFDEKGRAIEAIDDNGVMTFSQFDDLDRCFHTHDSHGNATAVSFNKSSQPIRTTTSEKNEATGQLVAFDAWTFYDELGRATAVVSPTGRVLRSTYDSLGRVVATSDAESTAAGSVSDPAGDHVTLPSLWMNGPGNTTRQHYDEVGRPILSVQHLRIDGQGQNPLATSQSGDGRITIESTYDLNSRLVAQKDDAGNATGHDYDALSREWRTTSADGTQVTRTFDLVGNVLTVTDANGSVTTNVLDDVYRVTSKTVQRGAGVVGTTLETYTYDGMGRVKTASDDDSSIARTYDTLGNLLREVQGTVTVDFEYDGLGLLKKTHYPGGRVIERTHDDLNRLALVRDAGSAAIASYVYEGGRVLERKNLLTGKS
jgi:YD repeat-containing protein